MSEYYHIEKPFLDQLNQLGWSVLDQGNGIPVDPTRSLRSNFREVTLREVFKHSLKKINFSESGVSWLTDIQIEEVYNEIISHSRKSLLEANKDVWRILLSNTRVDRNELTGEESPVVRLIDFDHPEKNSFIAINQFRIDTPGMGKGFIIPDIVLFVNGLPVVVVECKDSNEFTSNPLHEAITQLLRYSNQRESTYLDGLKEGEESLFWYNQFNIATFGEKAALGTITSTDEFYYEWKDIFPDKFKSFVPPLGKVRSQETLIQGMLPPETLLDIIRHFTLFMVTNSGKEVKIICRYQQYRAVLRIIDRLLLGKSPLERSGVIWHTQGSGKSLTMVMLVRKLRSMTQLSDYKVLLVNDRIDLEDQLTTTATLIGEKIDRVENTSQLKEKLATPTSNVVMVMIHKFQDRDSSDNTLVGRTIREAAEPIPIYTRFGQVNPSEKILILIDEAHRTQSAVMGLGDNLFEAFPNSTKIAFTGTPLVTDRHSRKTYERFGSYIDKYKLKDAVQDGATLQILYEGKTSEDAITHKFEFETKFEDLVKDRTEQEIALIKKKYGTLGDILEAEKRIEAIAKDIVNHYVDNIMVNGFKAQVVTSSITAAVRYKKYLLKAIDERLEKEKSKLIKDENLISQIAFLKVEAVITSPGTNEEAIVTAARKSAISNKAIENFKEKFDQSRPLSGIAILVVCDMLLTGFDAPVEQIMYLDKKMREHNLLQAIARVNRTYKGKTRGYVLDYIGNTNNLKEALAIYSDDDRADFLDSFKSITSEIPILNQRYWRIIQLFQEKGISQIESYVNQKIDNPKERFDILEQCIELGEEVKFRADFEVFFKTFMESMDIVLPNSEADQYKIPAKQFAYILIKIKNRYKDNSISFEEIGEKIKRLINEHLVNLGVDPKIPPTELFSEKFEQELAKNQSKKAVASEMEHAIRKHIKVSFDDDPSLYKKFSEKLEAIIREYKDNWDQQVLELKVLKDEVLAGRKQPEKGVSQVEAPFFDLMLDIAFGDSTISDDIREVCKHINSEIIEKLESTIGIVGFWEKGYEITHMEGEVEEVLLFSNIPELIDNRKSISKEIMALAKKRHFQIIGKNEN